MKDLLLCSNLQPHDPHVWISVRQTNGWGSRIKKLPKQCPGHPGQCCCPDCDCSEPNGNHDALCGLRLIDQGCPVHHSLTESTTTRPQPQDYDYGWRCNGQTQGMPSYDQAVDWIDAHANEAHLKANNSPHKPVLVRRPIPEWEECS